MIEGTPSATTIGIAPPSSRDFPWTSHGRAQVHYLNLCVVIQIFGVPFTPALSIVDFTSGEDKNAFAFSVVLKSCVTVTSLGFSMD
jgi:hypothetical protein